MLKNLRTWLSPRDSSQHDAASAAAAAMNIKWWKRIVVVVAAAMRGVGVGFKIVENVFFFQIKFKWK